MLSFLIDSLVSNLDREGRQMNFSKLAILAAFFVLMSGCKVYDYRGDYMRTYKVKADKKEIFESALAASMKKGLDVKVFESESGLIRFENSLITPWDLDQYCDWPWVYKKSRKPYRTFRNWDWNSRFSEQGNVRGVMSFTILVSGKDGISNLNIRSKWKAYNNIMTVHCNSKGQYESEFLNMIEAELSAPLMVP